MQYLIATGAIMIDVEGMNVVLTSNQIGMKERKIELDMVKYNPPDHGFKKLQTAGGWN